MTDKQIVEDFLALLNHKEGLISTLTGHVITYRELCKYQESGFNIEFKYEQVKYEGLLLEPKVIAYCTKEWNDAV